LVKGVSRRVVVVNSPEGKMFEQAIFILNEGASQRSGDIVREACRMANAAAPQKGIKAAAGKISPPVWGAVGAAAASFVWLLGVVL